MFLERLLLLCAKNGTDISNVLRALGLSTSKGTAWRKGSIPNGEILLMLAEHFSTSTDYLLGNTDDPSPPGAEEKPPAQGGGLSEKEQRLIRWFRSLPPETRKAILTLGGGPEDLID